MVILVKVHLKLRTPNDNAYTVHIDVKMECSLFLKLLRVKMLFFCSQISFRNSTASVFRTAEHVFYEPVANELRMIEALILVVNSGGFI
jgi:hypothetical protein